MVIQPISLFKIKRAAQVDKVANILLNEFDSIRHELLKSKLERHGYKVWSVKHLSDTISTLHDVTIDLMILDLDNQSIDEIIEFADYWKGIFILFQSSRPEIKYDFRCWMADEFIYKCKSCENILQAVEKLLLVHGK